MVGEKVNIKVKKEIDWEQRRYEIARTMLPILHSSYTGSMSWNCETAIQYADELINKLKSKYYAKPD